jgi:hypothetical protein
MDLSAYDAYALRELCRKFGSGLGFSASTGNEVCFQSLVLGKSDKCRCAFKPIWRNRRTGEFEEFQSPYMHDMHGIHALKCLQRLFSSTIAYDWPLAKVPEPPSNWHWWIISHLVAEYVYGDFAAPAVIQNHSSILTGLQGGHEPFYYMTAIHQQNLSMSQIAIHNGLTTSTALTTPLVPLGAEGPPPPVLDIWAAGALVAGALLHPHGGAVESTSPAPGVGGGVAVPGVGAAQTVSAAGANVTADEDPDPPYVTFHLPSRAQRRRK